VHRGEGTGSGQGAAQMRRGRVVVAKEWEEVGEGGVTVVVDSGPNRPCAVPHPRALHVPNPRGMRGQLRALPDGTRATLGPRFWGLPCTHRTPRYPDKLT